MAWRRLFRRGEAAPTPAPAPSGPLQPVLEGLLADTRLGHSDEPDFSATEVACRLAGAEDAELRAVARAAADVLVRPPRVLGEMVGQPPWAVRRQLEDLLAWTVRRKPQWSAADARTALAVVAPCPVDYQTLPVVQFSLGVAGAAAASQDAGMTEDLARLRQNIGASDLPPSDRATLHQRVAALSGAGEEAWALAFTDGDRWGPAVRARLSAIAAEDLGGLLAHLGKAGTRPSTRWRTQTGPLLRKRGARDVVEVLVEEIVRHEPMTRSMAIGGEEHAWPGDLLDPPNAEIARGALWAAAAIGEAWVVPALLEAGLFCGTTPGGGGTARSEKLANACAGALSTMDGDEPAAALAVLQNRVKNRSVRKRIDASLADLAGRAGLTPSQLAERTVPAYGLGAGGRSRTALGDHVAELAMEGEGLVLSFSTSTGRRLASTPAAVKAAHADALAGLRDVVKEAKKGIPAERARLEALLATDRSWDRAEWESLYLEHPVTGHFTRRLLWIFGDVAALPVSAGELVRADGRSLSPAKGATVRLWHPIGAASDDIAAWRAFLLERELRQPFKQAFREVYRLTPAELETAEYSNRFAGHILRYPQAGALMRARGWAARALGYWDGGYEGEAIREFPDAGVRSVFYFDLVDQHEVDQYGTPSLCATDQVRFERHEQGVWARMPLAEVRERVFCEAMRDVDLFVGVASIGADPDWNDRGVDGRFNGYWQDFSFGELAESALSRRAALERLLPRTRIATQCTVTDRYVVVRGRLRTYKIHIGSGNILMEPDDSYLCIVPARRTDVTEKLFLPFEEDGGRLSVIVSKAFLLADDDRITDTTVLQQLRVR